jgi:hypothetical protein
MTNPLKTFMGNKPDCHTGSSGFTNFFNNSPNPEAVWKVHPEAVIVDGDDDWSAPLERFPMKLVEKAELQPLAWFHSGISGITKSGVVLTRADFAKLSTYFLNTFGKGIAEVLTIYTR